MFVKKLIYFCGTKKIISLGIDDNYINDKNDSLK